MKDRDFLQAIHDRLIRTHGEKASVDYMHKLRAIIRATPPDRETPNVASAGETFSSHGALGAAPGTNITTR